MVYYLVDVNYFQTFSNRHLSFLTNYSYILSLKIIFSSIINFLHQIVTCPKIIVISICLLGLLCLRIVCLIGCLSFCFGNFSTVRRETFVEMYLSGRLLSALCCLSLFLSNTIMFQSKVLFLPIFHLLLVTTFISILMVCGD